MTAALAVQTFAAALATALATGLGGVPFFLVRRLEERWVGLAWAFSGGVMLSATVFNLIVPAVERAGYSPVAAGIAAGAAFYWAAHRWLSHSHPQFFHLQGASAVRAVLLIGTMFAHSVAEGVALGVGWGSGEVGLAILLSIAIALHNVPEGVAVSLPLRGEGFSAWACVGWSIFTSLPQPVLAVPAALLVASFRPLVPLGFGFASGAMGFLVFGEMVPEGIERAGRLLSAAAVGAGFVGLMLLQNVLQ